MPSDAERILAYIEEKRSARVSCCEDDDEPRSNPAELDAFAEAVKVLKGLSHFSDRRGHAAAQALATIANTLGATDATKP